MKTWNFPASLWPVLFLLLHLPSQAQLSRSGPVLVTEAEYLVTNTQDTGKGSLRQALANAFNDTGLVRILFQIPKSDPGFDADTGVWTISPTSRFNTMYNKHLIVDGLSQSAFMGEDTNPYGPEIEIDGSAAGDLTDGFSLVWSSLELIHVCINRFSNSGVLLWGAPYALIAGCYIGLGPWGWEDAGNAAGIHVYKQCRDVNIVPLDTIPNVISGNEYGGIIFEDTCTHSLIAGNVLGLNRPGTESVGGEQGPGIYFKFRCDSNTIVDNLIGGHLVGISLWQSSDNLVAGNRIGTDTSWTLDLFNSLDGILISDDSKRNRITGNTIGNNSRDGIRITGSEALYNTLSENSISMNEQKGINLVDGANAAINPPVFTDVIENEIFGTAPPLSIVEIFTDHQDEGRIIQGMVLADSAGFFGWVGSLQGPFDSIRATATDTLGNTSEFGFYRPEMPSTISAIGDPIPFTLFTNLPGQPDPGIQVRFELPSSTEVSIDVFNISGSRVAGIQRGRLSAGYHTLTWNTSGHAAGVYLIRMHTPRGSTARKCMVFK